MKFAPGAWRFAAPLLALAVPLLAVAPWASLLAVALGFAVLLFFRDPDRLPPAEGVLSPADGKVSVVRQEDERLRVGVFMNVTNVHVNRAPLSGTVEAVARRPGANRPAFSKDSDRNERVRIDCGDFEVALIAGWFARRIHPYVEDGQRVERGERIGHIAFGSRADVVFPPQVGEDDLAVSVGNRVRAGETVLAHYSTDRTARRGDSEDVPGAT
jgi:phosphatidylserine decarboxylase